MTIHNIPNQVIKEKLAPLKKVEAIILHHMAHDTADVKTVESWHINQGYNAIGYNFWVGFDGSIYVGRGFNGGAHTLGYNDKSIGIGFQGDYSKQREMPDKQFNAGVDVIRYVMDRLGGNIKIGGHKDFNATACPGGHFPLSEMKSLVKRGGEMIYNYIDENMPEWAREAVQWAVDNGIVKGDENGLNLDDRDLRYLVFLYRSKGVR